MRAYRSYLPIVLLLVLAWIAFQIGSTFQAAMTIISIVAWLAVVGMVVYMVLIRGMRFSLFKDEDKGEESVPAVAFEPDEIVDGEVRGRVVEGEFTPK